MIKLNPGDKYGDLTVIGPAASSEKYPRQRMWTCRCVCGNCIDVPATYLVNGHRTSCGCRRANARKDITGQRYGRLVALTPTGEIHNETAVWKWQCDCGNIIEADLDVVKWGGKRSCGCGRKEANLKHAAMAQQASLYVDGTDLAKIASDKVPSNNRSGCKGVYFETSKQR